MSSREYQELEAHLSACPRCKEVKLERPATLARACLEGAKLFKGALAVARRAVESEARK